MPLFDLRMTRTRDADGLDVVVATWGIDGPEPSTGVLGAIIDRWQADFTTAAPAMLWRSMWTELAAYPAAGGEPVAVAAVDPPFQMGNITAAPPDLALAISREVQTVRGIKPRGRTFWPIGSVSTSRPGPSARNDLLELQVRMHDSLVAEGYTPVLISRHQNGAPRPEPVGIPIVRYSVDDVWDTQRRRDYRPTERITSEPPWTA